MQPSDLAIGRVYFGIAYESEDDSRLMINSYEYLGRNAEGPGERDDYLFRFLGSDEELTLKERELYTVLDIPGLIEALGRIREGKHPHAS